MNQKWKNAETQEYKAKYVPKNNFNSSLLLIKSEITASLRKSADLSIYTSSKASRYDPSNPHIGISYNSSHEKLVFDFLRQLVKYLKSHLYKIT